MKPVVVTSHTAYLGTPFILGLPEEGVTITAGAFEKAFGNVTLNSVTAFDSQSIAGVSPDCGKLLMYSLKYGNFRLETADIKEGRMTRPIIR